MATAAIEHHAPRTATTFGLPIAVAGLMTFLFVRLLPDVHGKPLHEDEAVAGLISARPLGDVLHTVVLDRGGAPLHFVLAHLALAIDGSPEALRWLSVVFALATVALCYDLARRLAGAFAGLTAAALAASSQLLTIYGSFGRMYSLFAFASALGADLFIRAIDRPKRSTALAATAAALLPLAVHPFGVFLLGAEIVVAAWIWRGRALRSSLPVIALVLMAVPLLLADLRLTDRYAPEAGHDLPGGYSAWEAALRALGGATGGYGVVLGLFAVLAVGGAFALGRQRRTFVVLAGLAIAAPPIILALAGAAGAASDRLSPRHLIFTLPLWIVLIAAGVNRVATLLPARVGLVAPVAVAVAASFAPAGVSDPRTIPTGEREALAAPAAWLRPQLSPGTVLYPYSPLFLASLPDAAQARGWSRERVALERVVRRTKEVPAVFVSLPLQVPVGNRLRAVDIDAHVFPSWLILEQRGPFATGVAALEATADMLQRAEPVVPLSARPYLLQLRGTACAALRRLDSTC